MTADDPAANDAGAPDDDAADPAIAGSLRSLLVAHVDDTLATDATWAGIEHEAASRRAQRTRRRTITVAALAAAALVTVFLVVRLEWTGDGDTRVTTEPDVVTDPTEGTAADSWVRLLAHLPATAGSEGPLWIADLKRAREQAGVAPLADGASEDAWRMHSQTTFGFDNVLASSLGLASPEEVRAELGFGHEQVDQVAISYGGALPRYVATGRFDPDAIAAATAADLLWGPDRTVSEAGGLTVYRWGEDGMKLTGKRSPVRDLGTGGRMVVGDGWLAWCYTDDEVAAIVHAASDPRRSAAADDQIHQAVEAGDDALLAQLIVTRSDVPERSTTSPRPEPLAELEPIDLPVTWSGGSSASGGVEQFRIGYATEEQAAANLDAYRQNWERFAGDQDLRVEQQGAGLIATILLAAPADTTGVMGVLSDGTRQRLQPDGFVRYLNIVPRP